MHGALKRRDCYTQFSLLAAQSLHYLLRFNYLNELMNE